MRRLVLGIAVAVTTLVPTIGHADDQQIADFIKSRLQVEQQKGNLKGFNVDMRVEQGTVWFKGYVSNAQQEMTILKSAQQAGHLGVVQVVDDIDVKAEESSSMPQMHTASYQQPVDSSDRSVLRQASNQEMVAPGPGEIMVGSEAPMPFASNAPMGAMPMDYSYGPAPGYMPSGGAAYGAPAPMAASCSGGAAMSESPALPGYAWPAYAAHPNYAAVSYPKQYSPSAWPYIGPFYPYPQVPLGWRKVTLEWDDGWWMLDFHDK